MSTSSTSLKVPDALEPAIQQEAQYGIRFPNGTTYWQVVPGTSLGVAEIVQRSNQAAVEGWARLLAERARAAKIDLDEYTAGHRFLKRSLILSVTAPEEV